MKTLAFIIATQVYLGGYGNVRVGNSRVKENTFEGLMDAVERATLNSWAYSSLILVGISSKTGQPITEVFTLPGALDDDPSLIDSFISDLSVAIDEEESGVEKTYWNGEPCEARRVRVIVADHPDSPPMSWYRGLEGTERNAVEVTYYGDMFYLDDDDLPEDWEAVQEERLEALSEEEWRRVRALLVMVEGQPKPKRGDGWRKVTVGRGSPSWGHRSLPVARVVEEEETKEGMGKEVEL